MVGKNYHSPKCQGLSKLIAFVNASLPTHPFLLWLTPPCVSFKDSSALTFLILKAYYVTSSEFLQHLTHSSTNQVTLHIMVLNFTLLQTPRARVLNYGPWSKSSGDDLFLEHSHDHSHKYWLFLHYESRTE